MKALKLKWEQSYKQTYNIVMKSDNETIKKNFRDIDYNNLESTTISFEKIPMIKVRSKLNKTENIESESTNVSNIEITKRAKKNMSTNTGPDVIMMLNDLKESREVKNKK